MTLEVTDDIGGGSPEKKNVLDVVSVVTESWERQISKHRLPVPSIMRLLHGGQGGPFACHTYGTVGPRGASGSGQIQLASTEGAN